MHKLGKQDAPIVYYDKMRRETDPVARDAISDSLSL